MRKMNKAEFQEKLSTTLFEPLWRVAYQYLQDEIICFRLKPSERISEKIIADTLGISRSPARMALEMLLRDGLVEEMESARRCLRIAPINEEDCAHLSRTRAAIEGKAAYLAAKRITDEQLKQMRESLRPFLKKNAPPSPSALAAADDRFHHILVEASGNPYLLSVYMSIRNSLLRYRYYVYHAFTVENQKLVSISHMAIYNALRARLSESAMVEAEYDAHLMLGIAGKVDVENT